MNESNSAEFAVPRWPSSSGISAGVKRRATEDGHLSYKQAQRPATAEEEEEGQSANVAPSSSLIEDEVGAEDRQRSGGSQQEPLGPAVQRMLPTHRLFQIQIGDKLFRLSGASINSDAPSYLSRFFAAQLRDNIETNNVRTLYVDRDPRTFEYICLHLQGYVVEPKDMSHFLRLFADARFFSLPKLIAQLNSSPVHIRIGDEEFRIPRDLFSSPGNSPNFFSLGLSSLFAASSDAPSGLSQRGLPSSPSLMPSSVPHKSGRLFADLLDMLRGYEIGIRDHSHRAQLLRDARYYHLKGLEQRIIPHRISWNLSRQSEEILMRLEDVRVSGISLRPDSAVREASTRVSPASSVRSSISTGSGWVRYQRPYVDSLARDLIVEIGEEETTTLTVEPGLSPASARVAFAAFNRQTLSRMTKLFSVIAETAKLRAKQPLEGMAGTPECGADLAGRRARVRIGQDADVHVDGKRWSASDGFGQKHDAELGKSTEPDQWILKRAWWRLRVQPASAAQYASTSGVELILGAVKVEAYSNERSRNAAGGFLS